MINIYGERFGRLTVIGRHGSKGGQVTWICKCDCGGEKITTGYSLRNGVTKSCGCLHKEITSKSKINNLFGKKFGRLTVVGIDGRDNLGGIMWTCRCDCGNTSVVASRHLVSGGTKSCGCYQKERRTTHGMSMTKEYNKMKTRKRKEKSMVLDFGWTVEMEVEISKMFTKCVSCGSCVSLEIDHVLPLFGGNGLKPGNAVVLCKRCNSAKRDRSLNNLPKSMPSDAGEKILLAAQQFKDHWESTHPTVTGNP